MRYFSLLTILMFCCVSASSQAFKHFKKGYYLLESSQKVEGYIMCMPFLKEVFYKSGKGEKTEKIKVSKLKAVVVTEGGYDSLAVLSDNDGYKFLAKYLFASPTTNFYYKYVSVRQTSAPVASVQVAANPSARGSSPNFTPYVKWTSGSYMGSVPVLMYSEGNTTFELTRKNFTDVLVKALADSPKHVSQLKGNEVKYKDMEEFLESYSSINALQKK